MSYARFTVSYCCIDHYVGTCNNYVDIINSQLADYLAKQNNEFAKNVLHTNIMYLKASADVTFWRKMGG